MGLSIDMERIISAIEKAKKISNDYAQYEIIVPFKEADMIIALLKEQPDFVECKDYMYYDNILRLHLVRTGSVHMGKGGKA